MTRGSGVTTHPHLALQLVDFLCMLGLQVAQLLRDLFSRLVRLPLFLLCLLKACLQTMFPHLVCHTLAVHTILGLST